MNNCQKILQQIIVVAAVIVANTSILAQSVTSGPSITKEVMNRLCLDLQLSGDQQSVVAEHHRQYEDQMKQVMEEIRQTYAEQLAAQGDTADARFALALDVWESFVKAEATARQAFLDCVRAICSESQASVLARASDRLWINVYLQDQRGGGPPPELATDPKLKPDAIAVLSAAVAEGAELEAWGPRLLRVDVVEDSIIPQLAIDAIQSYEHAMVMFLKGYYATDRRDEAGWLQAHNAGNAELASTLKRKVFLKRKQILNHYVVMVNTMAQAVEESFDTKRRIQWERRAFAELCPNLYKEDSVDTAIRSTKALSKLDEAQLEVLANVAHQYEVERNNRRRQIVDLEVNCESGDEGSEKALLSAQEARKTLADQVVSRIKEIVGEENAVIIDNAVKEFHKETSAWAEVRP